MAEDEPRLSEVPPHKADSILGRAAKPHQGEHSTAEIVDLLADVPELRETTGREMLAHFISERVGAPLMLPDAPRPKAHLYYLVVASREVPHGLNLLVDGVEWVAPGNRAAARLRRLISPVRDHLEPVIEHQLEELLVGLRVPSLARLYYAATGGSMVCAPYRFTDAWDAFTALLDRNAAPSRPSPHLIFIAMLLRTLQAREAADAFGPEEVWRIKWLREWLATQTERLRAEGAGPQADYLDRMRDRSDALAPRADKPIYLIIQLDPVPELVDGRGMCRLSHWRQVHPLEWCPEPGDDALVPLTEVPSRVGELIREAEEGWAYQLDDSLVLEFVLPLDLLNVEVEEWTRDPLGIAHPTPLGSEYEILIRSQERLRTLTWHRAWRRRWQVLVDAAECMAYWSADEELADLRSMGDLLLSEDRFVTCVLGGPPDRDPWRSELWMALRAGIPVVLWHRADEPAREIDEAVREITGRHDIRGLPSEIKRLRAGQRNNRTNPKIALLWDDPNHFLSDADRLRAPSA